MANPLSPSHQYHVGSNSDIKML